MDEKIFDLLSKMYNEVQGIKDEMQEMKVEINKGFEKTSQDIVRLENKIDEKVGGLFDGYTQHQELMERMTKSVDKLTDNYEKQDVEIKVIHSRAK
jgi:archaellum component FlaC